MLFLLGWGEGGGVRGCWVQICAYTSSRLKNSAMVEKLLSTFHLRYFLVAVRVLFFSAPKFWKSSVMFVLLTGRVRSEPVHWRGAGDQQSLWRHSHLDTAPDGAADYQSSTVIATRCTWTVSPAYISGRWNSSSRMASAVVPSWMFSPGYG